MIFCVPTLTYALAVTCTVEGRIVTVKGKKGTIKKDFSHLACELKKLKQDNDKRTGNFVRIRMWFGSKKSSASVITVRALIKNMFTGVVEVSLPLSPVQSNLGRPSKTARSPTSFPI